MTLRVRAKVLLHVWSYGFYDMTFYKATSYDKKKLFEHSVRKNGAIFFG